MNAGGTATYLNELVPALNYEGVESHLVYGNITHGELEDVQIPRELTTKLNSLGRAISPYKDVIATLELGKIIKNFRPNIIHSHAFKGGLISRLYFGYKAKRVHTFHGHHLYDPEFSPLEISIMNFTERGLERRTDGLIFVGAKVREEILAKGIGKATPSTSIPPGIKSPKIISRERALESLNLVLRKPDQSTVLWLGRFVDVKRPEAVIELAKALPDVNFIFAGEGPLKSSIEKNKLDNLYFVGWQDRDVLLSATDILISTSRSEGMPLAIIEAQMCGIPVIAPDVGSVAEIVLDGETGFLTKVDLSDMAIKIQELTQNKDLLKQFSEEAKRHAMSKFSVRHTVQSHLNFYERILA